MMLERAHSALLHFVLAQLSRFRVPRHPNYMRLLLAITFLLTLGCGDGGPMAAPGTDAGALADSSADSGPVDPLRALCDDVEARLVDTGAPGWGIAIVEDGEIVVLKGGGMASIATGAPVTEDTPFRTLALSELYASIAALELEADGGIDLDAPVRDYLPAFEAQPPAWRDAITVRHLIHQTSGLPSRVRAPPVQGFGENIEACDGRGELSIDAWVAELAGMQMGAPPGRFQTRDIVSAVVLAQVLVAVEGRPFADIVRDQVFAPTGMTGAWVGWQEDESIAAGHEADPASTTAASPAGTCEAHEPLTLAYASINDLARLAQVLANGGLAPDGTRALAATTVDTIVDGLDSPSWVSAELRAGAGLHPWPDEDGTVAAILSVGFGYGVGFAVSPERRFAAVVVRNESNSPWQEALAPILEARLGGRIINRQYSPDPTTWMPDTAALMAIAGEYQNTAGETLTITHDADGLRARAIVAGSMRDRALDPMLLDRFNAIGAGGGAVRVFRDAAGAPDAVWVQYVDQPFWRLPAGPP